MEKLDLRAMPAKVQLEIRRKAVEAVRQGKTRQEVASIFSVRRETVGLWVKNYLTQGAQGLQTGKVGRPTGGRLKPWQAANVVKALIDKNPEQLKLPFYLWTREAVGRLIERRYFIRLSKWTIGRYLANWGFTPQKPVRRAYEQNPEAVKNWLSHRYPAIRREAKRNKATIYWGDEMGLRSDHAVGTTFGLKGQTPIIHGTGLRFKCNMISAIANRGELVFMVFNKRFVADVFIDFLRRMIRQIKDHIFLIVDRHPVHRAGKVVRWLKEHADRIRMFHLPDFSPELNPDELLNQDVKTNVIGRRRPHTHSEMVTSVRSYLWSRQRRPHVVQNFFKEKHVNYAAAA